RLRTAREAKPALSRQQYGETLADATATNTGKLHDMRTARFLPIPAPSPTRDGWRRGAVVFTSFGLVLLVASADSLTGGNYRLGLLYAVRITFAGWMSGRVAGLVVLSAALACWYGVRADAMEAGLAAALLAGLVILVVRLRERLQHAEERFTAAL